MRGRDQVWVEAVCGQGRVCGGEREWGETVHGTRPCVGKTVCEAKLCEGQGRVRSEAVCGRGRVWGEAV